MSTSCHHTPETENRNIERNPHPGNSVPSPYLIPPLILPQFHDTSGSVVSLSMCDVVPLHSFRDLIVFSHHAHALCFLPKSPGRCLWCCPLRTVAWSLHLQSETHLFLILNNQGCPCSLIWLFIWSLWPVPPGPYPHQPITRKGPVVGGGEEIILFKLNNLSRQHKFRHKFFRFLSCLNDRKDLSVWIPHISYFYN